MDGELVDAKAWSFSGPNHTAPTAVALDYEKNDRGNRQDVLGAKVTKGNYGGRLARQG